MAEYNNTSAINLTPTSKIQNCKTTAELFVNISSCEINNECEDQVYNSLPPMASQFHDQSLNRAIVNETSSQHSRLNDCPNAVLRNTVDRPMSPKVQPMAFTVDFGNDDSPIADTPKKLALREGIGRFAPIKKFREVPKSPRHTRAAPTSQTPSTSSTPSNNDLLSSKNRKTTHVIDDHDRSSPSCDSSRQRNIELETTIVMSLNNGSNEFVRNLVEYHGNATSKTTNSVFSRGKISPEGIVIDEENNIASNEANINATNNAHECSASDAGTYTIDNEDEENEAEGEGSDTTKNKPHANEMNGETRNVQSKGGGVFGGGIKDEKINTNEWVNMWSTKNSLIMDKSEREEGDVGDIVYDEQDEDEEEESSMSSLKGEGEGSRSRRKLPAVPSPKGHVGRNNNVLTAINSNVPTELPKQDQADDYLKDTISLMAAMEARLSNGEDDERQQQSHLRTTHQPTPTQSFHTRPNQLHQHSRPTTATAISTKPSKTMSSNTNNNKANAPTRSAAAIEQANKAKELANWKRRKNYDPLRSATNGKKAIGQLHQQLPSSPLRRPLQQPLITNNNEADVDSYSEDTCSDLDASSSVSQQGYHRQQITMTPVNRFQATMQARTNRAFALRQTNSLQGQDNHGPSSVSIAGSTAASSPKRTPSEESFNRNDGGRWSLRNKKSIVGKPSSSNSNPTKNAAMSSSIHRAQATTKKKSPAVRNVVQGGRSTSSLSSREAEFQAWKRRKNYDPLRSAQAASRRCNPASSAPETTLPSSAYIKLTSPPAQNRRGNIEMTGREPHRFHGAGTLMSTEKFGNDENLLRSASFHYPDGVSRVHMNVYTSEDEDDSQVGVSGEFPAGLYEVNEDELILTIGGGGDNDSGNGVLESTRCYSNKASSEARTISPASMPHWPPSAHLINHSHKITRTSPSRGSSSKLEALDNLVISTIFSVSTKLCLSSGRLMRRLQEQTTDKEQLDYLDTLLYVLEDVDPPMSPSKKTSRELAGTLRNLKKVEQALQTLLASEQPLNLVEDPSEAEEEHRS